MTTQVLPLTTVRPATTPNLTAPPTPWKNRSLHRTSTGPKTLAFGMFTWLPARVVESPFRVKAIRSALVASSLTTVMCRVTSGKCTCKFVRPETAGACEEVTKGIPETR